MTSSPTPQAPPRPAGRRAPKLDERLAGYKGVWVFVEYERGQVHPVSWELLGEGRKLADTLKVDLAAVVLGPPDPAIRASCDQAIQYGADLCYLACDPVLKDYRNAPYTAVLTELVNRYLPEILLLGATTLGRDLAGSVATTLKTGLTADCTGLAIDAENRGLAATRPTFGGSLLCTIVTLNYRPQMATIRPRVMAMPTASPDRTGRVIEHPLALVEDSVVTKILEFVPDNHSAEANLPFADIIVSGGRGMKRQENFRLIHDLARVLGAEVGASRPAVQAGWAGVDRQVGQSGKTVRPRLYIAAGISGAVQHRVGMDKSDVIIAINEDANAPIFDFAHYGIVGNAMTILPALTQAFTEHLRTLKRAC